MNWSFPHRKNSFAGPAVIALLACGGIGLPVLWNNSLWSDEVPPPANRALPQALRPFTGFVGEWRGAGAAKRFSTRGNYADVLTARWDFAGKSPALKIDSEASKLFTSLAIGKHPESSNLLLTLESAGGETVTLDGTLKEGLLTAESEPDEDRRIATLKLRILNADRFTLSLTEHVDGSSFRKPLGEVAGQRKGTRLAARDGNEPECVVTGGAGTIAVEYEGRTFYVCCTGCRDAFNDDPTAFLPKKP